MKEQFKSFTANPYISLIIVFIIFFPQNTKAEKKEGNFFFEYNTGYSRFYLKDELMSELIYQQDREYEEFVFGYISDNVRSIASISSLKDDHFIGDHEHLQIYNEVGNVTFELSKRINNQFLTANNSTTYGGLALDYLWNEISFTNQGINRPIWLGSLSLSAAFANTTRISRNGILQFQLLTPILTYSARPPYVIFDQRPINETKKDVKFATLNKHRGVNFKTTYVYNYRKYINFSLNYHMNYVASDLQQKFRLFSQAVSLGAGVQY